MHKDDEVLVSMKVMETDVEGRLRKRVINSLYGQCLKFVSPGETGVPDRIILVPGGIVAFVELKAPGETPTPKQKHWLKSLERMGFLTYVIDSKKRVDEVVAELKDLKRQLDENEEAGM